MLKMLERYQNCTYGSMEADRSATNSETQSMLDRLSELQVQERMWLEANKALQNKLEEVYAENQAGPSSWAAAGEQCCSYGQQQHPPQSHQDFFQPLECNSNLQIGYNGVGSSQLTASTNGQNLNGLDSGWML
ncbi:hypothetical protein OSB04_027077 [Centaurea solstitialis]|uniref:Uncharacterized protein n=1 Tax=Centaurea solstitialis TaxID=347529 RepID=A0AA38SRD1_9ASTR|nr:hypothetical protein OSB04_027077 [Centaurea solstitialis]